MQYPWRIWLNKQESLKNDGINKQLGTLHTTEKFYDKTFHGTLAQADVYSLVVWPYFSTIAQPDD